jgi:hypothetical protein
MPLPDQGLLVCGKCMKRVAGLVQQGVDVIHETYGIHEDEGPSMKMERFAVPARGLALSAFQIEQALVDHDLKLAAKRRIHAMEDALSGSDQLAGVTERTDGFGTVGVNRQIPGSEYIQA